MTYGKICLQVVPMFLFSLHVVVVSPVLAADIQKAMQLNREVDRKVQKADFEGALRAAEEMKAACGDHRVCLAYATYWLGVCNLELGRVDDAARQLTDAEASFRSMGKYDDLAVVRFLRGRAFARSGDYPKALEYFNLAEKGLKKRVELGKLYAARSLTYSETGNPQEALNDIKRAREILTDPNLLAMLNSYEAAILTRVQRYDEALALYRKAIQNYQNRQPQNLGGIAQGLNGIGHIDESRGNYTSAEEHYTKALAIARESGNRSVEAFSLNHLGSVNWKRGNYDAAMKAYQQALRTRKELNQKQLIPNTLNNIGLVVLWQGDYSRARDLFEQSRNLARQVGATEWEAWALHDMAFVNKDLGKFLEAQRNAEKAIKLAKKIQNRRLQATAELRLGNLYEYFGNFDKALKAYGIAAQTQWEIGDKLFLSNTLVDMANIYLRRAPTKLAQWEREQLKGNPAMRDLLPFGGQADTSPAENLQLAQNLFHRARELKAEIKAPLVELLCKFALFFVEKPHYGWTGDRRSELRDALKLIQEAEKLLRPTDNNSRQLLTYVKAKYQLEFDPAKSLAEFARLKALAAESGSLRFQFLANVGMGLATEKLKRFGDAEKAYQEAVNYAERIRDTLDKTQKRTFLHGEEILGVKHVLPYEGLARVRYQKQDIKGSLEASERTKARSFADMLAAKVAVFSKKVDQRLWELLDKAESKLRAGYQQLIKCRAEYGDRSRIPQVENELNAASKSKETIAKKIKGLDPDLYTVRFGGHKKVDEFALKDDEWSIAYEVTDPGVLIYLIQGKELKRSWFKAIPREELDRLVRDFRKPFEADVLTTQSLLNFRNSIPIGKRLTEILLNEPLAYIPEGAPIAISPDDVLGILSFDMLILDEGAGWDTLAKYPHPRGAGYLADRNPITYYQSLTALTLARARSIKSTEAGRALVVSDPVFSANDPRVRTISTDERKKLAESLPEQLMSYTGIEWPRLQLTADLGKHLKELDRPRTDLFVGLDAKKSLLLNKPLNRYHSMVFATHGYFGQDIPGIQEPVLVFTLVGEPEGQDGFLRMSEVVDLEMDAQTVALTACQTGLGEYVSGEGTMGMGRAFQLAGARSVLMSLWSVSLVSSVDLVERFFKHLKEGRSRGQALTLARQEIRRNGFEHPFFWAAFILAGER